MLSLRSLVLVVLLLAAGSRAFRPARTDRWTRQTFSSVALHATSLQTLPGLTVDIASLSSLASTPEKTRQLQVIDMPRVIPPGKPTDDWLLWFHGRDAEMIANEKQLVKEATGRIYFMTSRDGLTNWQMHEDSPVMGPNKESGDWFFFDAEHVGLGDVIKPGGAAQSKFATQDGVFLMYIFGGRNDASAVVDNVAVKGLRMEIGVAVSQDGAHWSRVEGPNPYCSIVEPGKPDDFDGQSVGWPSVLEVDSEYRMYYHTYNARTRKYCIGVAVARDGLMNWKKRGAVFEGDTASDSTAFDAKGASRRHVLKLATGGYKMWYEAISSEGRHSIGCASSTDGYNWTRLSGSPVFEAQVGSINAWDAGGVGSPHLVWLEEARRWRLYYTGFSLDGKSSIGVAESLDEEGLRFQRL